MALIESVAEFIEVAENSRPSLVECEAIENMRGDIAAGRKVMASDAETILRVYDRLMRLLK